MNRKKTLSDLASILPEDLHKNDVVFVCIGSDLSIGDSLGPIVGTELEKLGYHVIGTIKNPLHGLNLKKRLAEEFPADARKTVIAVDACMGAKNEVGKIEVRKGPLYPGAGLGKNLIKVGSYSIAAVVSSAKTFDFFHSPDIRLSFVMDMALQISEEINEFFQKK